MERKIKLKNGTIGARGLEMRGEVVWAGDQQEAGGPPEKKPLVLNITQNCFCRGRNPETGEFSHFFLSI